MECIEIQIGVGIGLARYGMTQVQLRAVLGEPVDTKEDESALTLIFTSPDMAATFMFEDRGRLSVLEVVSPLEFSIQGERLPESRLAMLELFRKHGLQLEKQDHPVDGGTRPQDTWQADDASITVYCEGEEVSSLMCGPRVSDQDRIVWPGEMS